VLLMIWRPKGLIATRTPSVTLPPELRPGAMPAGQ
jgi:hypothetical protein